MFTALLYTFMDLHPSLKRWRGVAHTHHHRLAMQTTTTTVHPALIQFKCIGFGFAGTSCTKGETCLPMQRNHLRRIRSFPSELSISSFPCEPSIRTKQCRFFIALDNANGQVCCRLHTLKLHSHTKKPTQPSASCKRFSHISCLTRPLPHTLTKSITPAHSGSGAACYGHHARRNYL